MAILNLSTNKN